MKKIKEDCKEELKTINFDFKIPKLPFKRLTYKECIELLQKDGSSIKQGDDFDPENEKRLCELMGIDNPFFIIDWPTDMKPFYAMPYEDKPSLTKSYDLMCGGIELSSGAQRIHIPELLIKQLESKGLNPKDFKSYVDAFRYGCPPHAGWSIGLERLTMVLTGQKNIRACTIFPRDRDRLDP